MRKQILYAPRLKGDLELGLEPSRIRSGVKDWARADFPGGRVPGGSNQEVYEESVGTTPNYRIGTRRVQDERTFHYMRADATYAISLPYWAGTDTQHYQTTDMEDCIEGATTDDPGAATDFTVTTADAGDHAADFFAGGWAILTVGSIIRKIRIRSSTATTADPAGYVTLTLWEPLAMTVAAGSQLQVFPSVYSAVASANPMDGYPDTNSAKVCMPIIPVTALHYFWGQTWGPCYGIGNWAAADFPSASEFDLVFMNDGSVAKRVAAGAGTIYQHAGYRLFNYVDNPTGSLIFFQLEIAP